jgi:hypothetical protein
MKATSYQAVVAQYHVESSDDEQDGGDHAHEHDGLMNYHQQSEKWHQPLWGESHQSFAMNAISSEEDDEGKHLLSALLNWFKLVYGPFGQSNMN